MDFKAKSREIVQRELKAYHVSPRQGVERFDIYQAIEDALKEAFDAGAHVAANHSYMTLDPVIDELNTLAARIASLEAELASIDARLSGRPTLTGTRAEKVERMCSENQKLTERIAKARAAVEGRKTQ